MYLDDLTHFNLTNVSCLLPILQKHSHSRDGCEMAFWPSYPACIMSGGSNLKGVEYIHKKRFAYPPPLQELEDLVAASMVEVLSSRSEIGQLRRKCDRYDECIDKWKKKASALQKQCQDLNQVSCLNHRHLATQSNISSFFSFQVMKKYITDAKSRPNGAFVAPIKITRSVGLQVNNNAAVQTNRVSMVLSCIVSLCLSVSTEPGVT